MNDLLFIFCYAPTNDSDDQDKEEFYSRLLTIIQDRPERNVIIVMGDFNAKIGSDNRGYEEIMGQQGLGEMNDNGERFADLCATSDLVIGVTSNTKGYTKRLGYHQTCRQRIRLITCASGRNSKEVSKMCVSGEGQMWLQTTISWLHG